MKTLLKNDKYSRESDADAEIKVKHHGYKYVPKSEWKEFVRDINKKVELKPLPEEMVKQMNEADKRVRTKKFGKK